MLALLQVLIEQLLQELQEEEQQESRYANLGEGEQISGNVLLQQS
jgi:hypothetical protein